MPCPMFSMSFYLKLVFLLTYIFLKCALSEMTNFKKEIYCRTCQSIYSKVNFTTLWTSPVSQHLVDSGSKDHVWHVTAVKNLTGGALGTLLSSQK